VASLRRGGWTELTMISRGDEIPITGGVAEMQDELKYCYFILFYFYFFLIICI